jgi:hypothetical protein
LFAADLPNARPLEAPPPPPPIFEAVVEAESLAPVGERAEAREGAAPGTKKEKDL